MAAQAFSNFGTGQPVGGVQPTSFVAADGFVGSPAVPFNPNNPSFQPVYMPAGTAYASASVAATGSTQATAATLTAGAVTSIASATAGTQFGVILPSNSAGSDTIILNPTAVAVAVYPATGGTINGQAANVPAYIPAGGAIELFASGNNNWSAQISGSAQADFNVQTSAATAGFTMTGPNLFGAQVETYLLLTGTLTAGANLTLPTVATLAAQMQQLGVVPATNASFKFRVINASGGAFSWTVVTNTGWTLTGTMTIAQNTWRDFVVTFNSATTATLYSVGTGTYS
jgi:hypothetical protein